MPADCDDLYPLLLFLFAEYECAYLFFVQMPLMFMYFSGLYLLGGADDTRRIVILAIFQLTILSGAWFLL